MKEEGEQAEKTQKTAAGAETNEKQEQAKKEQKATRKSLFESYNEKKESINQNIEEKYPKLAVKLSLFKEVWEEAFPDADKQVSERMKQRKALAKMNREAIEKEKDMTPEELEAMEANTPEWKRGALVVSDKAPEEKKGMFGRVKENIAGKISKTEAAENFKKSEEYEKLKEVRSNWQEFKGNLRDGVENT